MVMVNTTKSIKNYYNGMEAKEEIQISLMLYHNLRLQNKH